MRLTDEQIAEMRRLAGRGVGPSEIAERFGVSRQHASRVVNGHARVAATPAAERGDAPGAMAMAVDAFVVELGVLAGRSAPTAAMARLLAGQLDGLAMQRSAAAASAAERVAGRLADLLAALAPNDDEDAAAALVRMLAPLGLGGLR